MTPDDVVKFWFSDPTLAWTKSPELDAQIRGGFGALHAEIEAGTHEYWRDTATGALAYVIVLDQFSRNIFRDTPGMFASDARALAAANDAMARGLAERSAGSCSCR